MTDVPAEIAVIEPLDPIEATAVLLLLHVPPPTALVSVVLSPAHSDDKPAMAARGFTVTTVMAAQPVE
jgi:hypothetical protein